MSIPVLVHHMVGIISFPQLTKKADVTNQASQMKQWEFTEDSQKFSGFPTTTELKRGNKQCKPMTPDGNKVMRHYPQDLAKEN